MPELQCLQAARPRDWWALLGRSGGHDFYHRPDYHRLAEERGEGRARLFVYRDGEDFIALPLLLRPLPAALAPEAGAGDATSVYGYAGPICSRPEPPADLIAGFQSELRADLLARGTVAVFSRLHPLLPQAGLLRGLGECPRAGTTVAIDLGGDRDHRRRAYRENHRRDIRRLERLGVECERDERAEHLGDFRRLYRQTMARVGAGTAYRFEDAYFDRLLGLRPPGAELFVCRSGDRVVCAGIFLVSERIVEYHLSGTAAGFPGPAPLKLLLDGAADWAARRGAEILHLGGGLAGRDDGLLRFKSGFSDRQLTFRVWRWVVRPDLYAESCRRAGAAPDRDPGFFPAYRASAQEQPAAARQQR